jgi:purine-binding chemotaxis protein CheW
MTGRELSRQSAEEILRRRAVALAKPAARARADESALDVATFRLGREIYGIEARYVREVLRFTDYAPVPGLPDFFIGVTNLRGEILAVVDLGRFLGIDRVGVTDLSRLVILGEEAAEFGVLADDTREVVNVSESSLHRPPGTLGTTARACVRGVTAEALVVLNGAALLADPRLRFDQGDEEAAGR